MKKGPKVVVIGAGSYFFGKPVIYNMVTSPILRSGTLALVDTDSTVLETMVRLAERVRAHVDAPLTIEGAVERRSVLRDADFVVLSFSFRNAYYRGIDTRLSAKYGITMCSSDTIGPGGIFRALRELPEALRIADDLRELAPEAWLINFVNPTSTLGIGLMRYAPDIKSFALCDGNHMPYVRNMYLEQIGVLAPGETMTTEQDAKFDLTIAGVNHCTWVLRCAYEGKDRMSDLLAFIARKARQEYETPLSTKAKPRLNMNYAKVLSELYGAVPTAVSHTKEYVPFFQGKSAVPTTPEPLIPFDACNRAEEMAAAWESTRKFADGETPIERFFETGHGDHATDIIESMWGNLGRKFYINSPNRGAVPNLPADAFLELLCELDMEHGPRPLPACDMPRGLLSLTQRVLDTHELTAQAAVECDRTLLMRALAADPLTTSLDDIRNIASELLAAERDHLDERWFR